MKAQSSSDPVSSKHPTPLHWLFGLLTLIIRSGGELTRVVGEMHHTIATAPSPWDTEHQADFNKAPRTYQLIKLLFEYSADNMHHLVKQLPGQASASQTLIRLRSALNGVLGDKLVEWDHMLSTGMDMVDDTGNEVQLAQLNLPDSKGLVVFLHGLCLSEYDWQCAEHRQLVKALREQGHRVVWIRYNSGLPIWENGQQLADLLDRLWCAGQPREATITMIGHSMGGLLIRSARHYAEYRQQSWLGAQQNLVYLASPHDGAPLEKIGNFSNAMLATTPYSKPLMALGNMRSKGIRSLRFANVTPPRYEEAPQPVLPFTATGHHLLMGARRFYEAGNSWLGDGLVPEHSAMGGPHFPQLHPNVERAMLDQVGHIGLLRDHRMYAHLQRWLAKRGVIGS